MHEPSHGALGLSLPAGQAAVARRAEPGANRDHASLMIGVDLDRRHAAIREV
ncbi:MAG TPA: hypothetical protein VIJ44_05620 [Acidimicrobiia bacterium]